MAEAEQAKQAEQVGQAEEVAPQAPAVELSAIEVLYCGACGLPPEYCEFTATADTECAAWRAAQGLDDTAVAGAAAALAGASVGDGDVDAVAQPENGEGGDDDHDVEDDAQAQKSKKKKKKKLAKRAPAGAASVPEEEQRVVISRQQRKARKFVTTVQGVDSIPGLRSKDVAKQLGRRYATGASVSTNASGQKEIVIQGDVIFGNVRDTVDALLRELFHVPQDKIFVDA